MQVVQLTPLDMDYQREERVKTHAQLKELKKPKVIPQEKTPTNFSFKPTTFNLPPSIPSASKDSSLGFSKFIERNQFDLRTKPFIFSSPLSSSFSSSSNPFLAENSYVVGEDVTTTQINAATVARSDIAAPQTKVKDGDVQANVVDDVMASINPSFAVSSYFFGHLPQPKLTSRTGM